MAPRAMAGHGLRRRVPVVVTGNPIRESIVAVPSERDRLAKEAHKELELDPERKTVVVFGGSQGALHIDRATLGACRILRDRGDLQILLLTGRAHHQMIADALPTSGSLLVRALSVVGRTSLAQSLRFQLGTGVTQLDFGT